MIHLHVHSNYSLLSGACSIESIVEYAKSKNVKALALTDTNGMYGLIKFFKLCTKKNIKPILGAYLDDPSDKNINAVLLAKNNIGYSQLCKLITSRKLNDDFSLIKIINSGFSNIIFITSSLLLLKKVINKKNVFAELIQTKKQKRNSTKIYEYAVENGIKYVAVNPIYYLKKEDYQTHKVLSSIKKNTTVENISSDEIVDEEYYWKDEEWMIEKWKRLPDAIRNSDFIAENCKVDLELGKYKYPKFELNSKESAYSVLWKETNAGLHRNYSNVTHVEMDRLEKELNIINNSNFVDYFLIVNDIIKEAQRRGMLFIGRGSVANSIVSYCLGLTKVDPIKHNLYFERFLNAGRNSPPDIDIDFSWKERDEIVKYVFDKYGYENVAMISTTVTFRARSAFREVAKAYGFSNEEISKYSKYIPWTDARNLINISEMFPETKNINFKVEPWKSITETASKIANFPRHLSIHPSGIIITPGPVTNFTALEYAKNKGLGLIITQPDMYSIEDLGLIKIDLLSQRSLGVLRDTINMIDKNN